MPCATSFHRRKPGSGTPRCNTTSGTRWPLRWPRSCAREDRQCAGRCGCFPLAWRCSAAASTRWRWERRTGSARSRRSAAWLSSSAGSCWVSHSFVSEDRSVMAAIVIPRGFDYAAAVAHLHKRDKKLAAWMKKIGPLERDFSVRFEPVDALARAILYQQLSGKAAATIVGRVEKLMPRGKKITAAGIEGASDEALRAARSEEHTSELQSPVHLVCRLLLEK